MQLAREQLSPAAEEAFCALLHEITGGNPLFVREVLNASAAEDVGPVAANLPRLRELASRAGWRAVSVRLSRLPPEATRLARAVAILGDNVDPYHAAALADLDEDGASAATADLARVDVLRPHPPLRFVHPLVRRAVYDGLTPLERSSGHARGGAPPGRVRCGAGAGRRPPVARPPRRRPPRGGRVGRRRAARRGPQRALSRRR